MKVKSLSVPKKRPKWRTAPCGLRHQMDPFFMGLAVAEFLPADPAAWIDRATAARMKFCRYVCRTEHRPRVIIATHTKQPGDKATRDFLTGWLIGTDGGEEAVHEWLKARGYVGVTPEGPVSGSD